MDPHLLEAWNPEPNGDKLEVPVTHIVPAAIMGSGLGANQVNSATMTFNSSMKQWLNSMA